MKQLYTVLVFSILFSHNLSAQIITIPDTNFKSKLLTLGIDTNGNQEIEQTEAANVTSLNVSAATIDDLTGIEYFVNLQVLNCQNNYINNLDVTALSNLQNLNCSYNHLESINVDGLTNLQTLDFSNNYLYDSFDITGLTSIQTLKCSHSYISSINFAGSTSLIRIDCNNNTLQSIDLTGLSNLEILNCHFNHLSAIDLDGLTNLKTLNITNNLLTQIDLSSVPGLISLICGDNSISVIDVSGIPMLETLGCSNNQLTSVDVSMLPNLKNLNVSYNQISSVNVSSNTNLMILNCSHNLLTSLDISGLLNIYYLDCDNNQISNLNLTGAIKLDLLKCSFNNLTNLDFTGLTYQFRQLSCTNNQLTSLDLTGLHLSLINCDYNAIESLDLSGQVNNFFWLYCSHNQIQSLDVTNLTNLQYLNCSNNLLTTLNVNPSINLGTLICSDNQLTSLFAKNGKNEGTFTFSNNPSLQYVCADESQIVSIQNKIALYGYTNCHVNSYCSFVPGGLFYTIQGINKYDENNDGCGVLDTVYPNLKLSFTSGSVTGNLIANESGNYRYDVQSGTHVMSPILQNPTYFTVFPSITSVSFPSSASPVIKDFCITPNGIHNDLEIIVIPLDDAISGFDADYKIIYKNKGTHTQSGQIHLVFDDSIMDFTYSDVLLSNTAQNDLTWDFTNLTPFESREIRFKMNLNAPTDTPALNGGETIHYSALISGANDETPSDNDFELNQLVVNSFDPNDKTCLEGITITPDKIGDYVHYKIRFENTGTANAQNIVVKDLIDTTKFDITTLIPIDGSHPFYTRITNTNQVEFIFENIQLPFDDANNDGYVAFKIKTKPTLVAGNTFSNTASIYFDYNFPIITNTATTVIQALNNPDFEFSNYFELAPNPANEFLTITTKSDIEVSSISIYNTLGQLILVIPNAKETNSVDVSQLTSGTYFVKVISDKGSSNSKFIKQ